MNVHQPVFNQAVNYWDPGVIPCQVRKTKGQGPNMKTTTQQHYGIFGIGGVWAASGVVLMVLLSGCSDSSPSGGDGALVDFGLMDTGTGDARLDDARLDDARPGDAMKMADGGICATPTIQNATKTPCTSCKATHCCAEATTHDNNPDYASFLVCAQKCGKNIPCLTACSQTYPSVTKTAGAFNTCVTKHCDLLCNHYQPKVRLLNLAEGQPVDWCWRMTAAAWQGPVVKGAGLAYKKDSTIILKLPSLAPATIDVRAVAPGGSCNAPLASINAAAVAMDKEYTVVFMGGAKPLLRKLVNEYKKGFSGVRFVHAAPSQGAATVSTQPVPPSLAGTLLGTMSFGNSWTGKNISASGILFISPPPKNVIHIEVSLPTSPPSIILQSISVSAHDLLTTIYLLPKKQMEVL